MFHADTLVVSQVFCRLVPQVNEVHEHLVVTLLATLVYLEKMFKEFLVARVTLFYKNFCQENSLSVRGDNYSVFVVLEQINYCIKKSLPDLLNSLDLEVFFYVFFSAFFEGLFDLQLEVLSQFCWQNGFHCHFLTNIVAAALLDHPLIWFLNQLL